ncbi:hypothetical protein, partial [Ornithobacterium rhinotracheale]|uniref:hypothetical protein n=1 Tax=Ornithobacterium rhinotracheale TaxID=28251 RepID=UPI003872CCCD
MTKEFLKFEDEYKLPISLPSFEEIKDRHVLIQNNIYLCEKIRLLQRFYWVALHWLLPRRLSSGLV